MHDSLKEWYTDCTHTFGTVLDLLFHNMKKALTMIPFYVHQNAENSTHTRTHTHDAPFINTVEMSNIVTMHLTLCGLVPMLFRSWEVAREKLSTNWQMWCKALITRNIKTVYEIPMA